MANHQNESQRPGSSHEHSQPMCCPTAKEWSAESGSSVDLGHRDLEQGTIESQPTKG